MEFKTITFLFFIIQIGIGRVSTATSSTAATIPPTAAPGVTPAATAAPGVTPATTAAPAGTTVAQGKITAGPNAPTTPVTTTVKPICVEGTCIDSDVDDDYKCLSTINGTCPFNGGCETTVTKTATMTTVKVGCVASCPTSTTTLPTVTSSCCTSSMCNQYHAPSSAAYLTGTHFVMCAVAAILTFSN